MRVDQNGVYVVAIGGEVVVNGFNNKRLRQGDKVRCTDPQPVFGTGKQFPRFLNYRTGHDGPINPARLRGVNYRAGEEETNQ